MRIWGMSTEEFAALLDESFSAIKKASRKQEAQHYVRTRILADDLERALDRVRSDGERPALLEERLCA